MHKKKKILITRLKYLTHTPHEMRGFTQTASNDRSVIHKPSCVNPRNLYSKPYRSESPFLRYWVLCPTSRA